MINSEELPVCKRRGHSLTIGEGWSQCEWCRLWLREIHTIEEREEPLADETHSLKQRDSEQDDVLLNPAELAVCRRRGHSTRIGKHWSKCSFCGFWLRENRTLEEREDQPPESEMSLETQAKRDLDRMQERLNRLNESSGE